METIDIDPLGLRPARILRGSTTGRGFTWSSPGGRIGKNVVDNQITTRVPVPSVVRI